MTHPRQSQALQLGPEPLQELPQHLLRHVVAAVQVQRLQAGALPAGHPLGQHGVVHPVQLAGTEPGEAGYPGEDLDDGGLGQVGAGGRRAVRQIPPFFGFPLSSSSEGSCACVL